MFVVPFEVVNALRRCSEEHGAPAGDIRTHQQRATLQDKENLARIVSVLRKGSEGTGGECFRPTTRARVEGKVLNPTVVASCTVETQTDQLESLVASAVIPSPTRSSPSITTMAATAVLLEAQALRERAGRVLGSM
jgi:hypothetical protein